MIQTCVIPRDRFRHVRRYSHGEQKKRQQLDWAAGLPQRTKRLTAFLEKQRQHEKRENHHRACQGSQGKYEGNQEQQIRIDHDASQNCNKESVTGSIHIGIEPDQHRGPCDKADQQQDHPCNNQDKQCAPRQFNYCLLHLSYFFFSSVASHYDSCKYSDHGS
jgi:hypothetical protein